MVYRVIQGFTRVYIGFSWVHKVLQWYRRDYRGIKGFTRVYRDIQGFKGVYKGL